MDYSSPEIKKIKEGFVGQRIVILPPHIRKNVNENSLMNGFCLTAIGYYPRAAYHDRERPQGCPEYILIYCAEGKGEIVVNGLRRELGPNCFMLIPPFQPHHYKSSEQDPWSIYWVHFTGKTADLLYQRFVTKAADEIVSTIPYDEKKIDLFNQAISILENSFDTWNIEATNFQILYFLSSLIYHAEINPSSFADDKISRSVEFMKNNLQLSLTLEQLAENENLSVSRYCELFKAKTGLSPIQHFNHLKIQKSCQYLYFTDLSMKEICKIIGFEDPFYFSRIFKKTMGVSPTRYKSMNKNNLK